MFVRTVGVIASLWFCLIQPAVAQQPPDAAAAKKDHAAAIKDSLQKSMVALRQYEWVETTAVSLKGEEKSRTQNKCAYLPDGKVLKTPLSAPAPETGKQPRGLKGKVVENKKEDISEGAKEAVALVKQYVPPDPARIQAAKAAGNVSVTPPDASGQVRMVIKDYLKPGDSLALDVNAATDQIAGMTVSTFTDKKDPVGLKISWSALPEGWVYPAKIQLDVPSQKLGVAIENSGYKKIGG
jgi:hypothetical protein